MWFVQWLRPDGWWSLSEKYGPIVFDNKKRATKQLKTQRKKAPRSKWRISQKPGLWEYSPPDDGLKESLEEIKFYLSCDPITKYDNSGIESQANALYRTAKSYREALLQIKKHMENDEDDKAFRVVYRITKGL